MEKLNAIQEAIDTVAKARQANFKNETIWAKLDRVERYLQKVYAEEFASIFSEVANA